MKNFIYADFIGSYVNICVAQLILQHIVAVFLNKGLLAQTLYVLCMMGGLTILRLKVVKW